MHTHFCSKDKIICSHLQNQKNQSHLTVLAPQMPVPILMLSPSILPTSSSCHVPPVLATWQTVASSRKLSSRCCPKQPPGSPAPRCPVTPRFIPTHWWVPWGRHLPFHCVPRPGVLSLCVCICAGRWGSQLPQNMHKPSSSKLTPSQPIQGPWIEKCIVPRSITWVCAEVPRMHQGKGWDECNNLRCLYLTVLVLITSMWLAGDSNSCKDCRLKTMVLFSRTFRCESGIYHWVADCL